MTGAGAALETATPAPVALAPPVLVEEDPDTGPIRVERLRRKGQDVQGAQIVPGATGLQEQVVRES